MKRTSLKKSISLIKEAVDKTGIIYIELRYSAIATGSKVKLIEYLATIDNGEFVPTVYFKKKYTWKKWRLQDNFRKTFEAAILNALSESCDIGIAHSQTTNYYFIKKKTLNRDYIKNKYYLSTAIFDNGSYSTDIGLCTIEISKNKGCIITNNIIKSIFFAKNDNLSAILTKLNLVTALLDSKLVSIDEIIEYFYNEILDDDKKIIRKYLRNKNQLTSDEKLILTLNYPEFKLEV